MHFMTIVLLLFYMSDILRCSLTTEKVNKRALLQNCVDEIQKKYFKPADYIIYLNLEHKFENLKLRSNPVIIQTSDSKKLTFFLLWKADIYLMEVCSKNTSSVFKHLAKNLEWNPKAKFVIIIENIDEMLLPLLKTLHVVNIIFLLNLENEIKIFTYFPYDYERQHGEGPVLIDTFKKNGFQNHTNLFPNKLPSSYHNFTVRMGYIVYPPYVDDSCGFDTPLCGVEVDIFETIQKIMGFKLSYIEHNYSSWGYKVKENNTYIHGSSGLVHSEFDVAMGAYLPNSSQSWDFDLTFPYLADSLNWVVPAAKIEPLGNTLSAVYAYMVWITIGISYCTISLSSYFINLHKHGKKEISKYFIIYFQCLLGQAVNRHPKFWYNRLLFIFWVGSCYIISSYFQSKTIVGFKFELFGKQITTAKQIMESKIKFGFYSDGAFMFSHLENEFDKYIYKNYELCNWDSNCTRRVAYQHDFATIKFKNFLEYIITSNNNYKDETGLPLLYIIQRHVRNAYISAAFAKGFPIFEDINKLIIRLNDVGIISRYYDLMKYYKEIGFHKPLKIRINHTLELASVMMYFNILIVGLLLAFVVFILEHIRNYFQKRKQS